MTALIRSDRSGRLAWLALSGLVAIAVVLGAGMWVALRAEDPGAIPQRLINACLLISQSVAERFWAWTIAHPLTALVLVFLVGSMAWAVLRLGLSLLAEWRLGRRVSRYEAGQFPVLDRALGLAPEVRPARIWIFRAMTREAFTIGMIRPKVCLSTGLLQSMTEAEIEAVLRHEHAHLTALDPLRLAAVRLLSDFLWFLPITRLLTEAFSGLAELRADERAVAAGSDALELATAIVKTARGAFLGPRLAPALGGLALVEQRVTRLLGRERKIPPRVPWAPSVASGVMVMAFVGLLVGPAFATSGATSRDPMVGMRSMMSRMMPDCAREMADGPDHSMHLSARPMNPNRCGDFAIRDGAGV